MQLKLSVLFVNLIWSFLDLLLFLNFVFSIIRVPHQTPFSVLRQWSEAQTIVKEARYPVDNMEALWGLLIKHHAEDIPELIKLALIALVLPLHTAGCERVFSQQNIIVNKLRNRLSPAQSEKLLKIRLEGKGVTVHDFHRSLISFHKQKKRLIKSSV